MMNAARIAEDLSAACEALSGERGAEAALAAALKKLSRLQEEARKRAAAAEAALEQAFAQTEEARRELDALLASLDTDTAALERKEERLFALRALARKYGTTPDGLPAVLADFLAQREALDGSGTSLKDAQAAVTARASGLSGRRPETVEKPRRGGEETGSRRRRRTGAAETGPCEIPRRAGDAGR